MAKQLAFGSSSTRKQNPKIISVGPWGGHGGVSWDDGVNAGIRQIKLKMEPNLIHSINIEYDCNGVSLWSKHGGRGGNQTYIIGFDYPTERITSISGHYGTHFSSLTSGHYGTHLSSLTFESNVRIYGPYGVEDGTYFSFSMAEGKIVGFHGRSSDYLDCIGVYISKSSVCLAGPWGGKGGNSWDDGVYDDIRQIILRHGSQIDSIDIEYERNGASVWSKHGGTGGDNIDKIELDYPNERITSISGYYDTYVSSLTFESNVRIYGPYGVKDGKYFSYFSFSTAEGKIVGFHGRSGWYLDCIGVHISNVQAPEMSESLKPILFGSPPGGEGEDVWDDGLYGKDVWDDGVYSGIRQIIVVYDKDFIDSIHIEYDNNGSPFWLERGGSTVNKIEKIQFHDPKEILRIGKIQLDYPREILTSISGYYETCLRSLTFESNLDKYGPFGSQRGTPFESPKGDYKIVGFHGRSCSYSDPERQSGGSYFYGLGVFLSPLPAKSVYTPWGGPGGDQWDDGEYSGIHHILVVYDGNAIRSLHIQYDNNGSLFWRQHGGSIGNKIGKIQLDYPREILTSISGRYDNVMTSLTFTSNLKQYGPYGLQGRHTNYFASPKDVKIVGFHGSSSDESLHRIGVHLSNLHAAVHP